MNSQPTKEKKWRMVLLHAINNGRFFFRTRQKNIAHLFVVGQLLKCCLGIGLLIYVWLLSKRRKGSGGLYIDLEIVVLC